MKKPVNLKQRLDELRDEPAGPVEIRLLLDASLHDSLKLQATQKRLSLERYLERILRNHVNEVAE